MSYIDIILYILFAVALFWGFKKGLIAMLMTCIGLVASLILFMRFGPAIRAGIITHYNIGSFFAGVMAYLLILVIVAILVKILTMLFEYLAGLMHFTMLNRVAGAVFCFLNLLAVLVLIAFIVQIVPFLTGAEGFFTDDSTIMKEVFTFTEKNMVDYKDKLPQDILDKIMN